MTNSANMYDIRTKNISYDKRAIKDLTEGNLLEIGAGTGRLIDAIKSSNNVTSYTGIELSTNMVEIAKNKFPKEEIINDNFLTYQFNKKFDTILFSFNVINEFVEIEDKIKALRKAKELLNKNGKIVLFFPIHDFESWKNISKEFNWEIIDENKDTWSVFLQIKRDLINQISKCYIKYQNSSTIIEDKYENSLMTKNELLIMFNLLGFNVVKTFSGSDIDFNSPTYPELSDNMIFVVQNGK